jgi:hypothetical protein
MSVFEEVFTKREGETCQENSSASAFEGVFARRGRWPRRGWASTSRSGVDQHGEHLGSELASDDTADVMVTSGSFTHELETVMENPLENNEALLHEIQDHQALAMKEGAQFVVKNTFLTTEGDTFDSLKEFL